MRHAFLLFAIVFFSTTLMGQSKSDLLGAWQLRKATMGSEKRSGSDVPDIRMMVLGDEITTLAPDGRSDDSYEWEDGVVVVNGGGFMEERYTVEKLSGKKLVWSTVRNDVEFTWTWKRMND